MLSIFLYTVCPGMSSLKKCLFISSAHFLIGLLAFELYEFSICVIISEYFLPFTRLPFHFVDDFLCVQKLESQYFIMKMFKYTAKLRNTHWIPFTHQLHFIVINFLLYFLYYSITYYPCTYSPSYFFDAFH